MVTDFEVHDPILNKITEIASEVCMLQALATYAEEHGVSTPELDSHRRALDGLQKDVATALAARIIQIAAAKKYGWSPTYGL